MEDYPQCQGYIHGIPHKKLTMFSLGGHYQKCTCILALCYVCYHLLTVNVKTNVSIYSFQYMVFTIFYHSFNTPDVL